MSMYQSEREVAVKRLQKGILEKKTELDKLLWDALLAGQGEFFNTSSTVQVLLPASRQTSSRVSADLLFPASSNRS